MHIFVCLFLLDLFINQTCLLVPFVHEIYQLTFTALGRSTSESSRSQKPSSDSSRTASSMMEDPFVVLESASTPAASSSGLYVDPLEEISKFSTSGSTKLDNSSVNTGMFDDMDSFDNLGRRGKDGSPLRTGPSMGGTYSAASKEPVDKYPVDEAESQSKKKMPNDDFQESHETLFDMPPLFSFFLLSFPLFLKSPLFSLFLLPFPLLPLTFQSFLPFF